MTTRFATITSSLNGSTTELIRAWRAHHCNGVLGQLTEPQPTQHRLPVTINGRATRFRASSFELDGVVMLILVQNETTLRVGFYDLTAERFLPAIADLSISERGQLGSARPRTRDTFLRGLIQSARQCRSPRAVVGV
jgi:hypothetical protein